MPVGDPRELLVAITKTLDKLKIPYIITGGMAVLVWGRPRFTADIDIVIEFQKQGIDVLRKALLSLGKHGYIDRDAMESALETEGEFNFIHGDSGVKVDFWALKKMDDFDRQRFKRKKAKTILGSRVYFTSPEDLILVKLKWHKQSGSPRQLEDVESVVKISGKKLNFDYLKKSAAAIGVSDILENLLNDKCYCGSGKKYKKCHGM